MSDRIILHVLQKLAQDTHGHFRQLQHRMDRFMATLAEVQAAVSSVSDAVGKIGTDVTAAIADIQALQAQPGGISQADLDPIVQSLTAAAAALNSASTSLEAVLPPAPPAPTPNP